MSAHWSSSAVACRAAIVEPLGLPVPDLDAVGHQVYPLQGLGETDITGIGVLAAHGLYPVQEVLARGHRGGLGLEGGIVEFQELGPVALVAPVSLQISIAHGSQGPPDPVLAVDRRPEEEKLKACAGLKLTPLGAECVDEEAEPSMVYVT